MSIEIAQVTDSEANLILTLREDHFADLKAIDVSPAKLTRSMSAFANADGGDLYVGVAEIGSSKSRLWRGFRDVEGANGHIQAFESTFPLDQWVEYQFLEIADHPDTGLVLKASIKKTPDIRRSTDGTAYVRRGAQSLPVTDDEAIRRLEYTKGLRSFETVPVDAPASMITNSEAIIEFMLAVVPTAEPEPWLAKQLLIREDKPTVASLLLFADEPQSALPKQSGLKIYRYATSDPEGTRGTLQGQPVTIEGNLYHQIREAVRTTARMVEGIGLWAKRNGSRPVSRSHSPRDHHERCAPSGLQHCRRCTRPGV